MKHGHLTEQRKQIVEDCCLLVKGTLTSRKLGKSSLKNVWTDFLIKNYLTFLIKIFKQEILNFFQGESKLKKQILKA